MDPGFPVGGHGPHRGGHGLLRQLCFRNLYVEVKELGPLGGCMPGFPPGSANGKTTRPEEDQPAHLPEVIQAYNGTQSVIMGYSPHYLMFG